MKVIIGKPPRFVGCFQLAQILLFWDRPKSDERGLKTYSDRVQSFGMWLALKDPSKWADMDAEQSRTSKVLQWIYDRREQTVKVRIDRWDTWSLDWTLSKIIAPALRQLQATQHGAGYVEDVDVPDELRSTSAPQPKQGEVDHNHFKRWEWVMGEMIWAMENIDQHDDDREAQERIQNGCRLLGKYFTNLWD